MGSTRRQWLSNCVAMAAWAEVARAQQHAHAAVRAPGGAQFEILDTAAAAEIEALTAQIIPSDDGPGAREAGVIYFIDRALAGFDADKVGAYRSGMDAIQQRRKEMFPASAGIATLAAGEQIALLRSIEHTEFFELLRTHTLLGFLGNPEYGGNRDEVGWKHIAFDHQMSFQPPFGYYDEQARRGKE